MIDIREVLIAAGKNLEPEAAASIVALGPAACPVLVELLDDDELSMSDAPGEGWAPIHAATLLGELGRPEGIDALIRALLRTEPLSILHDRCLLRLGDLGAAALEPMLAAHEQSGDEEARRSLRSALSRLGVADERVFDLLVSALRDDPDSAGNLAEYGDPRALPALRAALDAYELDLSKSLFANQAVIELASAIEDLGGELEPSHPAKLEAMGELRRRGLQQLREPATARKKMGRNDKCWCGSGLKYKRCHEKADRTSRA